MIVTDDEGWLFYRGLDNSLRVLTELLLTIPNTTYVMGTYCAGIEGDTVFFWSTRTNTNAPYQGGSIIKMDVETMTCVESFLSSTEVSNAAGTLIGAYLKGSYIYASNGLEVFKVDKNTLAITAREVFLTPMAVNINLGVVYCDEEYAYIISVYAGTKKVQLSDLTIVAETTGQNTYVPQVAALKWFADDYYIYFLENKISLATLVASEFSAPYYKNSSPLEHSNWYFDRFGAKKAVSRQETSNYAFANSDSYRATFNELVEFDLVTQAFSVVRKGMQINSAYESASGGLMSPLNGFTPNRVVDINDNNVEYVIVHASGVNVITCLTLNINEL